jgi:hypothetical protein
MHEPEFSPKRSSFIAHRRLGETARGGDSGLHLEHVRNVEQACRINVRKG